MFGVTVWEMFTFGEEPWMGLNGTQILRKIEKDGERLAQPDSCSEEMSQKLLQVHYFFIVFFFFLQLSIL
jgi:hypothetical protein